MLKKNGFAFLAIGLLIGIMIGVVSTEADAEMTEPPGSLQGTPQESGDLNVPSLECPAWDGGSVYVGGDQVIYQDRVYRAKWWTQNEVPGKTDVWEDTGKATGETPAAEKSQAVSGAAPVKKSGSSGENKAASDFRVVGYYPSWKPGETEKLRYDVVTHIVYAFAIPTAEGGLRPLENPETAQKIIRMAHKNNVKVLLAVGGWSYNDVPLETTFMSATNTQNKRVAFADEITKMCLQYGFDGVDMDWEHPRADGGSSAQYEALMLLLSDKLHSEHKLLTAAVLSGATADGNIYYDAAAHTDAVLNAVDWIHIMAYDGGDGERHSPYEFAVGAANYWKNTRKLAGEKIVLGVPFYGRPSWASYEDILKADPDAWNKDKAQINGITAWYNGVSTIGKKTEFAKQNLGGIMVWEVTQDTLDKSKSLMSAIKETL